MLARLSLYLPRMPLRQIILESDKSYLIGRAFDCDIQLSDDRLSRRHATIAGDGMQWLITDLESKNGSLADGRPVTETQQIKPPAWLSLGGVTASFEPVSEETLAREQASAEHRRHTTQELGRALDPKLGLPDLLDKTLASVLELAGLERGFVLLGGDDGDMQVKAQRELSAHIRRAESFNGSWSAIRAALNNNHVVVYGDALLSQTLGEHASVIDGEIRALACVPLQIESDAVGVVYGDSVKPGKQFTDLDVDLLAALGEQAAVAIGIARVGESLSEVMQTAARHD